MLHSKIVLILFLSIFAAFVLLGIQINQKNIPTVYAASGYPSYFLETRLTNNLSQPTTMAAAPDGRLFVSEKAGKLRVIKDGVLLSTPFLTLSVTTNSERGLLGVAFDPDFTTNRYIYVYYTKTSSPVKNRISRFTASASNPDVVEAGSEFVLHDNIPSDAGNHQAGAIHFGLDGKLYIAVGDNGTPSNAQDLSKLTGKILRINADGTIPDDNPFVGQSGKKAEVWAYGFRNPFTFAVDKSTGKIFINDVGSKAKEEINNLVKGANYGWPTCEGTCSISGMTNPEYEYTHEVGQAIIGGAFYRGFLFPSSYDGDYFFADYVQGWIKVLDISTGQVTNFASSGGSIVGLIGGPDGALYFLTIGTSDGSVYKVTYNETLPPVAPTPTPTPTPTSTPTPTPTLGSGFTPVVKSSSSGSSSSALTLAAPAGTVDGDLLILTASADLSASENVTYTIPSGWTELLPLTRSDATSAGNNLQVWYKIANSEPANYTITPDHSNLIGGSVVRIDAADPNNPIGVNGIIASTTGEASTPAVTTDVANSLIFRFASWDQSKTLNAIPSGHTQTYHVDVSGHDNWGGYKEQTTAGNTGVAQLDLSSGSPYVGFTVAVRPSQGGGSTPTPTPTSTPTSNFPIATINSPSLGSTYTAGSIIQFSGSGTDPQDGILLDSSFSWTIVFHHDTHTHPFLGPITATKSGTFQIPNIGETVTSVWYRIHLAVVDTDGNTNEATRDIKPKKATIKLETVPSGLEVTLDGQPQAAPYSDENVVGMMRAIGVASPQIVNGRTLQFRSWSDGGGATHTIITPSSSKTYTATFEDVTPPQPGDPLYPTDDTFVDASSTGSNNGTKTYLSIDADPLRYSFLKFDLANLAGTSPSAILRIKVATETSKGIQKIWFTTSSNWNQSTVTYANRPILDKTVPAIGVINNKNVPGWMDLDLTSAVRQKVGGIFSIGIDSSSADGFKFNSKESTADKPTLIIH